MRIKTVDIYAFGGIKNKSFSFEDGFNVVFGENENGKSTIMAFIKMMFYGTGGKRASSSLAKNLRKKYKPWDGSVMAGSIEFENGGKNYRLERRFGDSDRTDEVFITDGFGDRKAGKSDIGLDFFGLSAAAFERSVFIGQLGAAEKDSDAEGELNQKLSNLFFSGDESVSYEAVKKRIEDAEYQLTTPRKVGRLDKNLKRVEEIKAEIESTREAYREYLRLKDDALQLGADISREQKKQRELKTTVDREQDIRNAEKYKKLLECKKQLDALNETLRLSDGSLADEVYLKKLDFCISGCENALTELEKRRTDKKHLEEKLELISGMGGASPERAAALEGEIAGIKTELSGAEKRLSELKQQRAALENENTSVPRKKINAVFVVLAAVAAIGAAALFAVSLPVALAAGAAAAVLAVLSFVLRPVDKQACEERSVRLDTIKTSEKQAEETVSELNRTSAAKAERLKAVTEALESSAEDAERLKAELESCENSIEEISARCEMQNYELLRLFERYGAADNLEEIKLAREEISKKSESQKELKKDINRILSDVGNISYEEAAERMEKSGLSSAENTDFAAVKSEYERISSEISKKQQTLAGISAQIEGYFRREKSPEALRSELRELKSKISEQEKFCKAANIAAEVLAQSFQELRGSYSAALEKKAGEIFSGITSGRYGGMKISNSFDINVNPVGEGIDRELDYMSSGTADQAYLSMRLALASMISEAGGTLPVLLDDALTQYDDERVKIAVEFLKQHAAERQIIMFTCHSSVADTAENAGAHSIRL